jgi:(1->4)-alpha-D-glucan 1-alpha-D-glucosylmutase
VESVFTFLFKYRPLLFEKDPAGEYCPPGAYPREALVCVTTHDLPRSKRGCC